MFELKDPTAKHSNSKIADVSISKKFWHCMGWWSIHEKNKNHAKPTFDSMDFWDFKTFHFLLILSPSNFVIEVSQSVLTRKLQVTILPPLTPRIFDVGGTTATFWQKTTQKQNSNFFPSDWALAVDKHDASKLPQEQTTIIQLVSVSVFLHWSLILDSDIC